MISQPALLCVLAGAYSVSAQYVLPPSVDNGDGPFEGFVSYSIEFSSFPDFAGISFVLFLHLTLLLTGLTV